VDKDEFLLETNSRYPGFCVVREAFDHSPVWASCVAQFSPVAGIWDERLRWQFAAPTFEELLADVDEAVSMRCPYVEESLWTLHVEGIMGTKKLSGQN
jgi:hypothetical protein